jgi:hypothetical protein
MPIVIGLLIVALLGGGASVAANNSLPGDFLYPVKIDLNEKVTGVFQLSPEAKAAWEAKLAETRLDETVKLAIDNKLSADWKIKLSADFKAHADVAEKNMEDIKSGGNAATAASLAADFEAGLKARQDALAKTKDGSSTEVDSELKDVVKVREDAEAQEGSDAAKSPEGAKNSAEGKINAAANVIASVKNFLDNANFPTSTLVDAQVKLSTAVNLEAEASAKLAGGDFSAAFSLAQQALRTAQDVKAFGEFKSEFKQEDNGGKMEGTSTNNEGGDTEKNGQGTSSQHSENEGEVKVKVGL